MSNSRKQVIGSAKTFVPLKTPTDIANLLYWHRSDSGITTSTTAPTEVIKWDDLSGNGYHLLEVDATRNPDLGASTGVNGFPGITFNGSTDMLGHTPISELETTQHIFIIFKPVGWAAFDYVISSEDTAGNPTIRLLQRTATPDIYQFSGVAGNQVSPALGFNHLIEALFTNSISDSVVLDNNAAATGINIGSTKYTGLTLGAATNKSGSTDMVATEIFSFTSELTGTDLADMRTYINDRYGIATL